MPKIIDKEVKKLEILHAAMKVFANKGILNTKMIDISSEAGVGKGTIYEYFRSKDEIFFTAFTYVFKETEQQLSDALSTTSDPVRKLELVLEITFDSFMGHSGEFAAIMMDFWAEGVRNKDSNILNAIDLKGIYAEYRKLISSILQEGIDNRIFRQMDIDLIASAFLAILDGLALQWIMDRKAVNLKQVTAVVLECIINGIKS